MSAMKLDNFDYLEYSSCYIHSVSDDVSFGLLQMFQVELRSLQETSNRTLYLIHGFELF